MRIYYLAIASLILCSCDRSTNTSKEKEALPKTVSMIEMRSARNSFKTQTRKHIRKYESLSDAELEKKVDALYETYRMTEFLKAVGYDTAARNVILAGISRGGYKIDMLLKKKPKELVDFFNEKFPPERDTWKKVVRKIKVLRKKPFRIANRVVYVSSAATLVYLVATDDWIPPKEPDDEKGDDPPRISLPPKEIPRGRDIFSSDAKPHEAKKE